MQAFGRVVHLGFFESNAKPYQQFSLGAILAVSVHGRPPGLDDRFIPMANRVRQAAVNAFDTAAAKFAYQSLRSKRSAPHRRRWEHRYKMGFFDENRAPNLFGILSGAVEYNDCTDGDYSSCCWP
jgi:hypothetical protein